MRIKDVREHVFSLISLSVLWQQFINCCVVYFSQCVYIYDIFVIFSCLFTVTTTFTVMFSFQQFDNVGTITMTGWTAGVYCD